MKKKRLLNILLLITAAWLSRPADAQSQPQAQAHAGDSFAYRAPLDTIGQAGWYRVVLTPEVVGKCRISMADIRIQSQNGAYVPYVLKTDFPAYQGESFIEFPILPPQKGDSAGDIRIGNWSGGAIHSLLLYMHSTDVERAWTLSGSNDGEKWYVIKEHITVMPSVVGNTTHVIQTIDFPASDYHYFRITQENKGVLPLNIFRAGVVTQQAGTRRYRPVPAPAISQKDSTNHHSYITLTFQEPYLVENLRFDVKAPRLYKRQVHILVKEEPEINETLYLDPSNHSFDVTPVKSKSITLDIDNEDNAPLTVEKIEASQLERYLLAWLEPGTYQLLAGDKHAQTPNYDLKYFVDTASREPAAILPGTPVSTNLHPLPPPPPSHDNKGLYLWGAIVAVLILLVWLCLNMLKSIRQTQQNEGN